MQRFIDQLSSHVEIPSDFTNYLIRNAVVEKLSQRKKILHPGQNQNELIFIISGVVRNYYHKEEKEWTSHFSQSGEFAICLDNFIFDLPCREYIESCTPLEVLKIPKEIYQNMLLWYPELHVYAKRLAHKKLQQTFNRMYDWRMLTASDRYYKFVEENKELSRQVQLQHIASYLDITPFSLSRIRRQHKLKKKKTK